jgi:hypothetical protein
VVEVVENVGAAERREREEGLGHEDTSKTIAAGGSTVEAVLGVAALILAILGLAGIESGYMLTIGVIAIGAALLSEGAAIAARLNGEGSVAETGMNAEFVAGLAGIVLGVLALLGIQVIPLTAAAVLGFGGAMLLGAGAGSEAASTVRHEGLHTASHRGTTGTAGAKILVGLAVIVLGILALVGIRPPEMLLVAVLILGGILMLSGVAMSSRFMSAMRG